MEENDVHSKTMWIQDISLHGSCVGEKIVDECSNSKKKILYMLIIDGID